VEAVFFAIKVVNSRTENCSMFWRNTCVKGIERCFCIIRVVPREIPVPDQQGQGAFFYDN